MKTHGMSDHTLYGTWVDMMNRCYNWRVKQFKAYGGRGIAVCLRWHDVRLFIEDIERLIGPRPPGMTLDRTDNDGNYEPGNVRWATRRQQTQNSRSFKSGDRSGALYQLWWRLTTQRPDEVHQPWHAWPCFRDDVTRLIGPRPPRMRFDRIEPGKPYAPGNVQWIDGAGQIRHARSRTPAQPGLRHGLSRHPLYRTWVALRDNHLQLLHPPWHDITRFISDIEQLLGSRPAGAAFRLIDPDGKYEPGNVCWGHRGRPPRM